MIRLVLITIPVTLLVTGCVSAKVNTINDTKAVPSYSAPVAKSIPEQIQKDPDAYRYSNSGKTYSLTLKNADLLDVLQLLSKESGLSIVAERALRGKVQIEAKNKKLGEILYEILKPLGYTASVENGMILVGRPRLTTRTFRMNYLKDTRNSTSNMNVSGFAAGGSGSVSVSTVGKSDYWGAVESSLEMFVFGTSGKGKREGGGYIVGESEKTSTTETKSSSTQGGNKKTTTLDSDDPMLPNTQLNENQLKQLVVNEMAGIIQITDFSENLEKIASFLSDVEEGSKRQVLIQAHIMEVNLKDSFSLGLDWQQVFRKTGSTFTAGQTLSPATNVFKIGLDGFNSLGSFNILLNAMKEQGNLNMLSSPKVSALNNQKAVIKLTTKQVSWVSAKSTQNNAIGGVDTYTTTPQVDEVGIFLDVTPQIGSDGSIIMQIHPSVSEIKEISTSPDKTSTKPVIDVREIDTMVNAKAGETIVIAGLISDKLNEVKRSVPLLGDIPYLGGALFSYNSQDRTKTELVIMMTPYVLNPKSIEEIRREHEKRIQNISGDFYLINNMGSMVTEKSSRDWLMRSEPHRLIPKSEVEEKPEQIKSDITVPAHSDTFRQVNSVSALPPQTEAANPETDKISEQETKRQLEQQQAKIERLENEIITTKNNLSRERLENESRRAIESKKSKKNDTSNQEQPKRVEELQNITVKESTNITKIAPQQSQQKNISSSTEAVQTISTTTNYEQTLYQSAVTAYKIGDCAESIKIFDAFSKAYPNSPFYNDAAYYRKDCAQRTPR